QHFGQKLALALAEFPGTHRPKVLESFDRLCGKADLVVVEGAGSPAEVNLRPGDIANMGFAAAAGVPVILVGDIDRGGVIASLVGTRTVLADADAEMIKGFLINKFRGDTSLFDGGMTAITAHTSWPGLGVLPFFPDAAKLPAEDILDLQNTPKPAAVRAPGAQQQRVKIVVPRLARIANFDDLDPLKLEPCVDLEVIAPGRPLPRNADLILLPGSKTTIADLADLRAQGWDIDIMAHVRHGGQVLGLCGGYQMLGRTISDPDGIEGDAQDVAGLGLLDIHTVLTPEKKVRPVTGQHLATGLDISGYEIHLGATTGPDTARPVAALDDGQRFDGAQTADGGVAGTYVHGVFSADTFRRAFLAHCAQRSGAAGLALELSQEPAEQRAEGGHVNSGSDPSAGAPAPGYAQSVEATLEALADHLEAHLDIEAIWRITQERSDGAR
ncbi:MAG: cobyric acid synthase, partial [Pseudomonadota bacterium]